MRTLVTILSLMTISLSAFANLTNTLTCEIRNTEGGEAVASKRMKIMDLTSVIVGKGSKTIEIGTVDGNKVEISLSGYYSGKPILALKVSSTDGHTQESLGTAANVLGFTSKREGQYLSVLCREAIPE